MYGVNALKASDLISNLQALIRNHGDLELIQQGDEEGNNYNWIRGIERTFVGGDLEQTYDSESEAEGWEREYHEVFVIYP